MPALFLFFILWPNLALAEECDLLPVESEEGASIIVAADGAKSELEVGDALGVGERIATGEGAWVDLRLCDGSGLRIGEHSKLAFEEAARPEEGYVGWAFELIKGSVLAVVQGEEKSERVKMRVRTPSAALGVRGTEFLVETDATEGTSLHTTEGEVLMGPASDFGKLASLRGRELGKQFQSVARESMSRIAKGEARPRAARKFQLAELRRARKPFFQRAIARMQKGEARAGIEKARAKRRERQDRKREVKVPKKQQNRQLKAQPRPQRAGGGKAGPRKGRGSKR
jgi:hypothetical protein